MDDIYQWCMTTSKIEASIFGGPQIVELFKDNEFYECLNTVHLEQFQEDTDIFCPKFIKLI